MGILIQPDSLQTSFQRMFVILEKLYINFLNLLVMVNTPPKIENKFAEKLRFILKKQQ